MLILQLKILQSPVLTLCNLANGGKALIFRRFRHLPFGRVLCISQRIPARLCAECQFRGYGFDQAKADHQGLVDATDMFLVQPADVARQPQ